MTDLYSMHSSDVIKLRWLGKYEGAIVKSQWFEVLDQSLLNYATLAKFVNLPKTKFLQDVNINT